MNPASDNPHSFKRPPEFRSVIVHPKHQADCAFANGTSTNKTSCRCPKSFLVSPGSIRKSAFTTSWTAAEAYGRQWCVDNNPFAEKALVYDKPIMEVIDECILQLRADKGLKPSTVQKMNIVRNSVERFVLGWNEEKPIAEQLVYIHQMTTEHLRQVVLAWDRDMPEKKVHTVHCDRSAKTCKCRSVRPPMAKDEKENRRACLVRIFDLALDKKYMPDNGRCSIKGRMKKPIRESNPAAHLEVTGRRSRAKDRNPLSDSMYHAYMIALQTYCQLRKFQYDFNLYSRMRTYLRFLKRTGLAKSDGYTCRRDAFDRDEIGWFIRIRRMKTGAPVIARISDAFYEEVWNVPAGVMPTDPDYLFWSGYNYDRARYAAQDKVRKNPKLDYDREYRDALHTQLTNAAEGFGETFLKLTDLIPRELLYRECNKDEFGILIEPTLHCFRYTFSDDFMAVGGSKEDLAIALGDTVAVTQEHYMKRSPKRMARVHQFVQMAHEAADRAEALAVKEFPNTFLKQ